VVKPVYVLEAEKVRGGRSVCLWAPCVKFCEGDCICSPMYVFEAEKVRQRGGGEGGCIVVGGRVKRGLWRGVGV
jgi:hypothetical protein